MNNHLPATCGRSNVSVKRDCAQQQLKGSKMNTATTTTTTRREEVSLNRINNRIESLMSDASARLDATQDEIERHPIIDEIGRVGIKVPDDVRMQIQIDDDDTMHVPHGGTWVPFTRHARSQLFTKLGIPTGWANEQADGLPWQRQLIADTASTFVARSKGEQRLLLRAVKGKIAGVMSDRYRRTDSALMMATFRAKCEQVGAVPLEVTVTETRWELRAIIPTPIRIDTPQGPEWVAICIRLANSDFGAGATSIDVSLMRLVCINGMLGENVLRAVHLGGRLGDAISWADDTYKADSKAMSLAMRDAIGDAIRPEAIEERIAVVTNAAATEVDPEPVIKGLVKARRLGKGQAQRVNELLMKRDGELVPAGRITKWSIAQAVSAAAKDEESADNSRDLQAVAGTIVGLRTAASEDAA